MSEVNVHLSAVGMNFGDSQATWKYYNQIKKKAMEQEFSWTGLLLSLSIAFFIVFISAWLLRGFYEALALPQLSEYFQLKQIKGLDNNLEIIPSIDMTGSYLRSLVC